MKTMLLLLTASALLHSAAPAQTALDTQRATQSLSTRIRNPVKSTAPILRRTYERKAGKGLDVEIDVEVIHREDGSREEHAYVPVPILFRVGTDSLLDELSHQNVLALAGVLRGILEKEPAARFTIQGHTSAEGAETDNQALSEDRARKIHHLLTTAHHISDSSLSSVGFGEQCVTATEIAPETQRQKDRRVLVVRN